MLGRRIAARQPPPTCLPELRSALLDEWCNIPQDQIDNLILSMPSRFKAVIHKLENAVTRLSSSTPATPNALASGSFPPTCNDFPISASVRYGS
ncbi:transposable element Tcb1 transposase [Trichonephila clavipes]|nr:transposable element Tcb1 transposase [Trichonephila clavipes]